MWWALVLIISGCLGSGFQPEMTLPLEYMAGPEGIPLNTYDSYTNTNTKPPILTVFQMSVVKGDSN